MRADQLVLVRLAASLVEFLGLRRALLQQPGGKENVEEELHVLRLPVLGDVDGETPRREVAAERDWLQAFVQLLPVEVGISGESLADQRGEEQQTEHQTEGVLAQELPHRCSTPSTQK